MGDALDGRLPPVPCSRAGGNSPDWSDGGHPTVGRWRAVRDAEGHVTGGEIALGPVRADISGGGPPDGGPGSTTIVGVDDADAQYRRILTVGVDLDLSRDETYGPRTCHVTRPVGNRWYLWQGGAAHPPG